ncbi:MAG: homoserine kinase [Actinomycetota bacterium]|nr:homoserine kinase [Actinomycetota bacterium]
MHYRVSVRARAPASCANLGPGFDVLALAMSLYVEVDVRPANRLIVRTEGEGAGLADDASHLAARVAIDVAGHERLAVSVTSEIPVARGLGSSASLAVAAAAAAGSRDPLAVAARVDGHPENAAASVVGGLVAATLVRGAVRAVRLPLDMRLGFVVVVPERPLPTARARQLLPHQVSRSDATFNLGRLALLLAGLADRNVLVHEATEDRLHQDYRIPLFPEAPQILARLVEKGALAACWSGAGPSLLAICDGAESERVRDEAEGILEYFGTPGRALEVHPDLQGLTIDP